MNPLASMSKGWWSFQLPGYRPRPELATYSLFPYESLPPIGEPLDDQFTWLKSADIQKHSLADGVYGNGQKPDLGRLAEFIGQPDLRLPASFVTFMLSLALQRRVRSCTDNYLELPDHLVNCTGHFKGHLIHFMADSQICFRWYLYIGEDATQFVVSSQYPYGFDYDAEYSGKLKIDLEREPVWYCSASFTEFIWRFWIENEIWFRLVSNGPLTSVQQAYVNYYR